jgi:hypothetical protein
MAGMLMNYTYKSTDGATTYSGQVVADSTTTKYNYVAGQTYAAPGGSYTIGTGAGTPTTAPVGSVYQTSYTSPTVPASDSYHYDPASKSYYDVKTQPYDPSTGKYTPPTSAANPTPSAVPMWSTLNGLGSEYGYVKDPTGNYHVYGGGGTANARIDAASLGMPTSYDYKFMYADGSYYDGKVIDDGTYGYKVGGTGTVGSGTYSIYAVDAAAPAPGALAGYDYTSLYYDASNKTMYPPSDITPGTPYYQQQTGYGGIGTATDYIKKADGYHAFSGAASAATSAPLTAIPLPA